MTIAPVPVHRRPTPWIVVLFLTVVTIAVVAIGLVVRHDGTQSSSVSGTTQGSGVAAVQPRHVASFTGVELAGTNLVTVKVGGQRSVVVRADDNLLRQVTTQVSASTLVIGDKGSFSAKSPMSVEVTVPSLDRLVLSGTGNVAVAGIQTQQLKVVLSGDGTVQAAGTATHVAVVLLGSGEIQLADLVGRDVGAELLGSGLLVVTAAGSLDAAVRGSGAIVYYGNPKHVIQNVSGSGSIARG